MIPKGLVSWCSGICSLLTRTTVVSLWGSLFSIPIHSTQGKWGSSSNKSSAYPAQNPTLAPHCSPCDGQTFSLHDWGLTCYSDLTLSSPSHAETPISGGLVCLNFDPHGCYIWLGGEGGHWKGRKTKLTKQLVFIHSFFQYLIEIKGEQSTSCFMEGVTEPQNSLFAPLPPNITILKYSSLVDQN